MDTLFLAEDKGILRLLSEKGRAGVNVRIALRNPESLYVAQHSEKEADDAMSAKIQKALALYRLVAGPENVVIRLHHALLYNSSYSADDQLIVNQHAYGIPTEHTPVFCLRDTQDVEMTALYRDIFERVWAETMPLT